MSTQTRNPLAEAYMRELRDASKGLPRASRRELIEEITEHLEEALGSDATEAETRNELDRLGDAEQIVAEAQERLGVSRPAAGAFEWITICLLLAGGFLFLVGWFVGVAMLWSSRAWTTRDKLIGTLLIPFGAAGAPFLALSARIAAGSPLINPLLGLVVWSIALAVPVATAVYLGRRIRRPALA